MVDLTPGVAMQLRILFSKITLASDKGHAAEVRKLVEESLNILAAASPVKYAVNGRLITLGEFYEGHGKDDPSGRYYTYDDTPLVVHWMSTGAMAIRMEEIG